jgi:hypothetical protein
MTRIPIVNSVHRLVLRPLRYKEKVAVFVPVRHVITSAIVARSVLQRRFQDSLGKTIYDAILAERLCRVDRCSWKPNSVVMKSRCAPDSSL